MQPTQKDLIQVVEAIESEDPDAADDELQAMRDALLYALGEREATADAFIRQHVRE